MCLTSAVKLWRLFSTIKNRSDHETHFYFIVALVALCVVSSASYPWILDHHQIEETFTFEHFTSLNSLQFYLTCTDSVVYWRVQVGEQTAFNQGGCRLTIINQDNETRTFNFFVGRYTRYSEVFKTTTSWDWTKSPRNWDGYITISENMGIGYLSDKLELHARFHDPRLYQD